MSDYISTRTGNLSERLYRLLLLLYPRAFREEYASEMLFAFRDAYADATRQEGTLGLARLWRDLSYDLVKTVCIQHARSWMQAGEPHVRLAMEGQMATGFIVQSAHHTDAGRTRGANEDNALVLEPSDDQLSRTKGRLFIVADGMGGSNRGDLASQLAVQRISDSYYSNPNDDPLTCIREAFQQANLAICEADRQAGIQNDKGYGLGTTCVAAVLREKTLYVANVGDSRAYVLRDGQLRQITRDHSLVAQLIERGEITPAEARTHEQRHLIYRALGMPDVEVACFIEAVQEGDTLLLCTDGLSNQVGDEEIRAIIEQYGPEESVQRLIACANERGGLDNITAVVVRIAAA